MIARVTMVIAAALLVTAMAGCGGDDEDRIDEVASCLEERFPGFVSTDQPDLDVPAAAAQEGGVAVLAERQQINIGIHDSEQVARRTVAIYRRFDAAPGKVERHGTAVAAYTARPTAADERAVEACLDST